MTDAAEVRSALPTSPQEKAPGEAAERALPPIDHPVGPLRQAILDHLLDSVDAGPQSVAQILAAMPAGTTRGNVEAAILREYKAGRIERVSPGHYLLAKPKPVDPPEPTPADDPAAKAMAMVAGFAWPTDPDALAGVTEDDWFAALEAWHIDPTTWDTDKLGPPPDQPGHRVPLPILARFKDRVRKREERQREADDAAARQAAADRELRDQLLAAANGNFIPGPGLDDMAPIRAALETVPIEIVLDAIRCKTDRRIYPANEPATSWCEPRLLKAIAERFCRWVIAPNMVAVWSTAGNVPRKAADASDVSTAPETRVPLHIRRRHNFA